MRIGRRIHATRASLPIGLAFLTLLTPWAGAARATQVVEWQNVPIPVTLTVGEERVLAFPDHVEVGVPATLTPAEFRTQSTGGTVLWLARAPFEVQRLRVRLIDTGHVLLFDVQAVNPPAGTNEPLRVVFPDAVLDGLSLESGDDRALTPVTLTRFAAQQLYAPQRTLRPIAGVRRVPMGIPASLPLYRDSRIVARPLARWQGGGYYVTAVKLENTGRERLFLDPRDLRGRFLTATFQHNSLGPQGSRSDTTCVYLVTEQPLASSVPAGPRQSLPLEGRD